MPKDKPDPELVATQLHSAAIHVLRSVRGADTEAPIGPAQLSALSVLVFGGPRTVGALAAAEQVRSPTMSGIVAALERRGLVRREPHGRDRRSSLLHATRRGKALLERARRRRIALLVDRLAPLEPAELQLLADAAALMERALAAR